MWTLMPYLPKPASRLFRRTSRSSGSVYQTRYGTDTLEYPALCVLL